MSLALQSSTSFGMRGQVGRDAYVTMMQGKLKETYKSDFPEAVLRKSTEKTMFGGYLKKRGRDFFRTVKTRYFELRNNFIVYFKSEKESEKGTPIGAFSCKLLVNVITQMNEISLVFASGFTQYLEAANQDTALKWKYQILRHKHLQKVKREQKHKRLKDIKRKVAGAMKTSIAFRRCIRERKEKLDFEDYFLYPEERSAVI